MPSSQERNKSSKLTQPKTFSSKLLAKDESSLSTNINIILSSNESISAKNNQTQRMSRLKQPIIVTVHDKNKNILPSQNVHISQNKNIVLVNNIDDTTKNLLTGEINSQKILKLHKPSKLPATPGLRSSSAIAKPLLKPEKITDILFTNSENNLNCSPQRNFKSSEQSLDSNADSNEKMSTSIDINLNSQLPIFKRQVGHSKLIKPKNEASNSSNGRCKTPTNFINNSPVSEIKMTTRKIKSPIRSSSSDHIISNNNVNTYKSPLLNKKSESKLPSLSCQIPKVLKTTPVQPMQNVSSTIQISLSPSNTPIIDNVLKLSEKNIAMDSITLNKYKKNVKEDTLEINNITPMQPLGLQSPFLRMAKETLTNKNQNKLFLSTPITNKLTSDLVGSSDSLEDILSSIAATEDTDMFDTANNKMPHRKIITVSGVKSDEGLDSGRKLNYEMGYSSDGDILSNSDKRISSGYISDGASSISDWMKNRGQNLNLTDKCSLSNSDTSSITSYQLNAQSVKNSCASQIPKVNIQSTNNIFYLEDQNIYDADTNFNRNIKVRNTLPSRGKKPIIPLDGFAQKNHHEFLFKNEDIAIDLCEEQKYFITSPSLDCHLTDIQQIQKPDFDKTRTQNSIQDSFDALKMFGRKGSLGSADNSVKNISYNLTDNNKGSNNAQSKEIIDAYISKYSKNTPNKKPAKPLQECGGYSDLLAQQSPLHQLHHHHHLPKSPYSSLGRSSKLTVMRPPSFLTCGHMDFQNHPSTPKISIQEDKAWNELDCVNLIPRRSLDMPHFMDIKMTPMNRRDSNSMYSSIHKSGDCTCESKDHKLINPLSICKQSIMGDSLNGSSLSLGSCSSLFSNVEDFNVHEIRRLRRELELAQTRVSSLNMQLNINENVVQAFEQSVANLNARLQCLTFLAGDKMNHIGELHAAMNHINNSRSFSSFQHNSINAEDDQISEGQDIEKKKRQKKWLTSIGKAFNRKRTKHQNESIIETSSIIENDIKNENELIRQLEMRLQEREMKLTDAQLDALSSAHQLDLLRNAMSQMQKEMMQLKNDNNRLQQLITNKNISSNPLDNKVDSILRLSLYVRSSNTSELNKSSEILISNFFSDINTSWDLLEKNITKEFLNYLSYLDSTQLYLSTKSIKTLSIGDLEWKIGCPPSDILPSSKLMGLDQSISISLYGATDNAVDTLSFDMMLNCNVLQVFIDALSKQQVILLFSIDKNVLIEFANKLSYYALDSLTNKDAKIQKINCLDHLQVDKYLEEKLIEQVVLLENFHELHNNNILLQLMSLSSIIIAASNVQFESLTWLPSIDSNYFIANLDDVFHSSEGEQLSRFFRRNFIEFYGAQDASNEAKLPCENSNIVIDTCSIEEKFAHKVLEQGRGISVGSAMQMWAVLEWIVTMQRHIDDFIIAHSSRNYAIGYRLYISCPMDYNLSLLWFQNLWNYSIVPKINDVIRKHSKSKKISDGWIDPTEFIIDTCPWSECQAEVMFMPILIDINE